MPATTPTPGPSAPEIVFRAWLRSIGLFRRTMEPFFGGFGVTAAQWAVLNSLHRAESEDLHEVRMADLGERLLIRPPSVTTVVHRSQEMGLVSVQPSAIDHRAKSVALTAAGRTLVKRVGAAHERQIRDVFAGLTEADQARLAKLLGKLGDHLSAGVAAMESRGHHDSNESRDEHPPREEA